MGNIESAPTHSIESLIQACDLQADYLEKIIKVKEIPNVKDELFKYRLDVLSWKNKSMDKSGNLTDKSGNPTDKKLNKSMNKSMNNEFYNKFNNHKTHKIHLHKNSHRKTA